MVRMYPGHDTADLAAMLGVTAEQLRQKASRFGVSKSPEFIANLQYNAVDRIKRFQFKPGDIPVNRGKKKPYEITEAMRKTFFVKGHKPMNAKSDGFVSVRKDKHGVLQKFVRLSENKWDSLARVNYRTYVGDIPEGGVIRFRDGDALNCEPENLELISKTLNMLLNSNHGYDRPVAEVKEVICFIKKEIKERYEKQDE